MTEPDRKRQLRGKKRIAFAALAVAAALWITAHSLPPAPWVGYLRAAAEAAMIGGLADWFAVTALFRRPLGLPFPHTNLLEANRAKIARGLAAYVEREFLRSDMLAEQVRAIRFGDALSDFLREDDHRERIFAEVRRMLRGALVRGDASQDVLALIAASVREGMTTADLRPAARVAVRAVADSGLADQAIRHAAAAFAAWLDANRDDIRRKVADGSSWYVPKFVDSGVAARLAAGLGDFAARLQDPASVEFQEMRRAVLAALARIETDGRALPRLFAAMRAWTAGNPEFLRMLGKVVDKLGAMLARDLDADASKTRAVFDVLMRNLVTALDDPTARQRVDAAAQGFILDNVDIWADRITDYVETTLMRQDARKFIDNIEIQIGADLQYIRLSGTLIGAAIGAALHAVVTLGGLG